MVRTAEVKKLVMGMCVTPEAMKEMFKEYDEARKWFCEVIKRPYEKNEMNSLDAVSCICAIIHQVILGDEEVDTTPDEVQNAITVLGDYVGRKLDSFNPYQE